MESIGRRLTRLLRVIGIPDAEVSVLFTGDRAMRALNRRYRGQDTATDVLSFSLREGPFPRVRTLMLGDIVVSVPSAERQARAYGHSLAREIDRLLVHGLLHLTGYDHERGSREKRRMERRERQLLRGLEADRR